jgi:predicted small secreted protein
MKKLIPFALLVALGVVAACSAYGGIGGSSCC